MAATHQVGGRPLPIALVSQAIPHLSRDALASLVESLIDRLDALDPDPDVEPNGDELDGSIGEDDFCRYSCGPTRGAGCPIADPDLAVDDSPCDESYQNLEEEAGY